MAETATLPTAETHEANSARTAVILPCYNEEVAIGDVVRDFRAALPDAVLIYKPHPDVEAGLRPGAVEAGEWADVIASNADPAALLDAVDAVWTITSAMGFEALLRGVPVTVLGAPFYAGWGLTEDLGRRPARRGARPCVITTPTG